MKKVSPIKDWNVQDKPREKFLANGPESLTDAELLAIMLGSGIKNKNVVEVAEEILESANYNLDLLGRKTIEDLCEIDGVGPVRAMNLLASLEFGLRRDSKTNDVTIIRSASDVAELMYSKIANSNVEEFWVICLNRRNEVIHCKRIHTGGISSVLVDPKTIFKYVLSHESSSFIACHNHPSGNLKPSSQDIILTKDLLAGAKTLQLNFLDHVILSFKKGMYLSLNDEGVVNFSL